MRRVILFSLLFSAISINAQRLSEAEAVLSYFGVMSEEQLDQYDVEHMCDLYSSPVEINYSSQERLRSSGLFSAYQIASLMKYIKENGDVLSFSELSAVDGFGRAFTERIAPFISLSSASSPGRATRRSARTSHDLVIRGGLKKQDETTLWNSGMKYRLEAGDRLSAALSVSRSYDSDRYLSGHLAWRFRRLDARMIIGDYNARFGQGLTLWNGISMSGVSSISTLMKSQSGISPSWSFTGTSAFTGMAASVSLSRLSISAMLACDGFPRSDLYPKGPDLLPAVNISWLKGAVQLSMTNYAEFSGVISDNPRIPDMKSALDVRSCMRGKDIFAEFSFDWVNSSAAALAGTIFPIGESIRAGLNIRYYPYSYSGDRSASVRAGTKCSNEYACSAVADFSFGEYVKFKGQEGFGSSRNKVLGDFSADFAYFPVSKSGYSSQLKLLSVWDVLFYDCLRTLFRVSERIRSGTNKPFRTEASVDLNYISEHLQVTSRINLVKNKSIGFLTYVEAGYKTGNSSVYLRQGAFFIDDWDDRIYAYERDAPGSFNVPAFYGRGVWSALSCSLRVARLLKFYVRGSLLTYPFMPSEKKKPGKAELKLQMNISF